MKVKLLREVRERFSIYEYPAFVFKYRLEYKLLFSEACNLRYNKIKNQHLTLQDAKDEVLKICKLIYFKHSKQYKLKKVKHKVWHI